MMNHKDEKNTCRCNGGVVCDVSNCVYHDGDNYCTAERISVGTANACCCSDTICATFKPKSDVQEKSH